MKSYSNIVDLFVERYEVETYTDEMNVVWYNLEDVAKVIDMNMDWYKHLFTTKVVVFDDKESRYITKAAMVILLQNTETLFGEYLKMLGEYDAIRLKLDVIESKLFL